MLAAVAGTAGCEMFAVSNTMRGRDDEIVCALFLPIDALDRDRLAPRFDKGR